MKNLKKYLKGELPEKELDDFTQKLIQAKFDKEKKERWSQKLDREYGVKRQANDNKVRRLAPVFLRVAAAAALIILALVFYPRLTKPSHQRLADNFLKQEKFAGYSLRKGPEAISLLRIQAMNAYNDKKYNEAIRLYRQILDLDKNSLEDNFYLALNALYLNDPEKALAHFLEAKKLSEQENDLFAEEINWFLSLAYLKSGDQEKARIGLENIPPNGWKFENAQRILKTLE